MATWTQADADKLKAAIAGGLRRVTFGDKTTEFQDLGEMRKLLKEMLADIAAAASPAGSRSFLVQHDRGV